MSVVEYLKFHVWLIIVAFIAILLGSTAPRRLIDANTLLRVNSWGACMAQLVKRPTSAQVLISLFVGSSPMLGSVLTAHSLEPASDSGTPSLSAPPPLTLSLSLSKINMKKQHLKTFKDLICFHAITLFMIVEVWNRLLLTFSGWAYNITTFTICTFPL